MLNLLKIYKKKLIFWTDAICPSVCQDLHFKLIWQESIYEHPLWDFLWRTLHMNDLCRTLNLLKNALYRTFQENLIKTPSSDLKPAKERLLLDFKSTQERSLSVDLT